MRHSCNFRCAQHQVVDSNIIDQAREETVGREILVHANVQTTSGRLHAALCIFGYHDAINKERSLRTVPHQAYTVPIANVPILVLLTMWCAGVPNYDGKWEILAK